MERLRTPLLATAVVTLLYGISALFPALARSIFGYEIKDAGLALFLAAALLGYGVVLWAIAQNPMAHGSLANSVVVSLVIALLLTLYGWYRGDFGMRTAAIPIVLSIVLGGWIWSARPKTM
ncbi:MAG TPA: hypothetical protein VGR24_04700 [bacterium]|nr:hypothetical protein [bacterium]